MKTTLYILILFLISNISFGQRYSITIDSLTKSYIKTVTKEKQAKFNRILSQRDSLELYKRIDTMKYDVAIIEENYYFNYDYGVVTEGYFMVGDTFPKYIFQRGKNEDFKSIYKENLAIWISEDKKYDYNLKNLIEIYSKLKPVQELPYNKRQTFSYSCTTSEKVKKRFKPEKIEELKQTYQVQTMIDKSKNKILVSVQFAPKRPKFKSYIYFDW